MTLVTVMSGCALHGVEFRSDHRLTIVSPQERKDVALPTTISWRGPKAWSHYAVFLDTAPMPFGKNLGYLARDDKACQRQPGCPDVTWLQDRGIYLTSGESVTIQTLEDLRRDHTETR